MIEKLIDFCSRHRLLVLWLTAIGVAAGIYSMRRVPLDALPDLSDTQVIIYTRWDRSPDILEDQVTFPIVTSLVGAPGVKAVRGFSDFGYSYVYVIFADGTDMYWARSRVLESLSKIQPSLPEGARTELGPDASGVGWVFQYALVDKTGQHDLSQLRSLQDWYLRYWLQSVPGVAEVASIGGFQKQYQINVNPNRLAAYGVSIDAVMNAVRASNDDVGGRVVEFSGAEYMVRSRGYIKSIKDIESIVVGRDKNGVLLQVRNVASVTLGPDIRRGVSDLDGEGDTVGGIVIMRHGENALRVISRVKEKLDEIRPSLPPGVEILVTYDRSGLIREAISTVTQALSLEMGMVALIILLFLWHFPSALLPILTLPVATILSFIPMLFLRVSSSVMSLGGIAVAVGDMVDASIVMAENAHKRLEEWAAGDQKENHREVIIRAMKEVGPSAFYSLIVMAVAFLPIFALEGQAGRLFKPLAYTKNLALAIAAILAVTLAPAVRMLFTRVGTLRSEESHPISRWMHRLYEPAVMWVLRHSRAVIAGAIVLVLATVPIYFKLGREFMPTLEEGSILYMPTTLPGLGVTEAQRLLQAQDQIFMSFPEVERVFGKAGRAETSTDPAPFSMMETTVILKPKSSWRKGMTYKKLVDEMDQKMRFPGVTNAWTMPIKARIDMLSTGIRTAVGIKITGTHLEEIERLGIELEKILPSVSGTRSVFAERAAGGRFLDFKLRRDQLALHALTVDDANRVIMSAIGGESVTTTFEGRERYSVNVRYPRELRDDMSKLRRVLVATPAGAQVPLIELADIEMSEGPSMIRNENGWLTGYVYIDVMGTDVGGYVARAKKVIQEKLVVPTGYSLSWSGQFESMEAVKKRLWVIVPLTLCIIILLLYLSTRSAVKSAIVLLAVPFSAVGAFWLLWALDYNMSAAVWVGLIALLGLDAETGIFMLLYLDMAYEESSKKGKMRSRGDLKQAILQGSVRRIRPKVMTVATNFMGFLPILWATGTGSDVMKRVAAPMVGGLFTSFALELLVYPALYYVWKRRSLSA